MRTEPASGRAVRSGSALAPVLSSGSRRDGGRRGIACARGFQPLHVSTAGGQARGLDFARRQQGCPSRLPSPPRPVPLPSSRLGLGDLPCVPRRLNAPGTTQSSTRGSHRKLGVGVLQELPECLSLPTGRAWTSRLGSLPACPYEALLPQGPNSRN